MDAGWFPDPNDASLLRYWDGTQWTEHTAAAPGAAPAGAAFEPAAFTEPAPFVDPVAPIETSTFETSAFEANPYDPPAAAPIEVSPFAAPAEYSEPTQSYGTGAVLPPPGWLPDPEVAGGQRYWDGEQWTDHRTAPAQPQAAPGYGAPAYANQAYATPGYGYPGGPVVSAKSPALSLIVSFFVPGVGSMINGDVSRGVLILVLYLVSFPLWLVLIGIPMTLGIWIWGMVDAYQGAVRWNAQHGIIS